MANEVLILWMIVLLCFVVFGIWLITMAVCPNGLIRWLAAVSTGLNQFSGVGEDEEREFAATQAKRQTSKDVENSRLETIHEIE